MLQIESMTRRPWLPFSTISVVYDTLGRKPPGKTVVEALAKSRDWRVITHSTCG